MKYITYFVSIARHHSMEYEIGPNEPVSMAVIRAVSAVEGREIQSLPPLSNVFDTDALDAIFSPRYNGTERSGGRLSFVYSNCQLTIDNGEYLTLTQIDPRRCETRVCDVGYRSSD